VIKIPRMAMGVGGRGTLGMWRVVVLCAVLLVGCSAGEKNQENLPGKESTQVGGERDPLAVAAALRLLDPCALVGSAGVPVGPHSCAVRETSVHVDVGAYLDPQFKEGRDETVLDGVRVTRSSGAKNCTFTVLAGANLGIGVDAPTCDAATTAARTVIAAVAAPDSVALPDAGPDSCDLLKRVAGDRLTDLSVRYGITEMGLCQAMRRLTGSDGDGWTTQYHVRIAYGRFGALSNEDSGTLEGRAVTIYETSEDCEYTWRVGASPSSDPELADHLLRVRAPDCAEAAELATAVMATETTLPETVAPQRPITIAA